MEWKILKREDKPQQQIYWDYDNDGNQIPNTDKVFDYVMVNTTVEYYFPNHDKTVTVEINHFNPQSEKEIETGIYNRGVTEERKLSNN